MKHVGYTPGPWLINGRIGGGFRITANEGHVSYVDSTRYVHLKNDPEAHANARLMADAPRLAEENERLKTLLDEALPLVEVMDAPQLVDMIKAALAGRDGAK